MLADLKKTTGAQKLRPVPMLAPVGGWNARDALGEMDPVDAIDIENIFPKQNNVVGRNGYTRQSTLGTNAEVPTLIPYHVGSAKKLFACSNGKIFDGLTGTEVYGTGITQNVWAHTTLRTHLIMCNGVDVPLTYDGTTFATHGWTDASSTLDFTKLHYAFTFKSRIYFAERGSQRFWYGDTQAIAGPLESFDLALTNKFEGELLFFTSIQNDGGDGKDDLFVAVFSSGDLAVYQGSDPGGSDWNAVGKFRVGAPLSRFAHTHNGTDVLLVTSRGYEQLVRSTKEGEGVRLKSMISDKIQSAVSSLVSSTGSSDQWQLLIFNAAQMLIIQAPITNAFAQHHVRNINTGAWTRFALPKARSWAILDKVCYMGSRDGRVHIFNKGTTDDGTPINLDVTMAWNSMPVRGRPQSIKQVHKLKFYFTGAFFPTMQVSIAKNFGAHSRYTSIPAESLANAGVWNVSEWNQAEWAYVSKPREVWHKHNVKGVFLSLRLKVIGQQGALAWNTVTMYVEDGGII